MKKRPYPFNYSEGAAPGSSDYDPDERGDGVALLDDAAQYQAYAMNAK